MRYTPTNIVHILFVLIATLSAGCLRSTLTIIDNEDGTLTFIDTTYVRDDFIESRFGEQPSYDGGDGYDEISFASSGRGNSGDIKRGSILEYKRFSKDSTIIVDKPRHLEKYNYSGLASNATMKVDKNLSLSTVDLFGRGAAANNNATRLLTIHKTSNGRHTFTVDEASIKELVKSLPKELFTHNDNRSHMWWKEMYVHIAVVNSVDSTVRLHYNGALIGNSSHQPKDATNTVVSPSSLNTGVIVKTIERLSSVINNDPGPAHDANAYTPNREAKDLLEEINETLSFADYWRTYQMGRPKSEITNFKPESTPGSSMGYFTLSEMIPEPIWLGSPVTNLERDFVALGIVFTETRHDSGRTLTVEQYTPWRATFEIYEDMEGGLVGITKYIFHDALSEQLMEIKRDQSKKRMGWINATEQETLEESSTSLIYRYRDPLMNQLIEQSSVYTKTDNKGKPWRLTTTRRIVK